MAATGKGFTRTTPNTEFRNPTSWGRTRQAKNLAGAHERGVTVVESGAAAFVATSGHATENQRYLYLYAPAAPLDDTVVIAVWGYTYAFGEWFQLLDSAGNPVTIQLAAGAAVSTFTGGNPIDIAGVDRVAFRSNKVNALDATTKLMAAANTIPSR